MDHSGPAFNSVQETNIITVTVQYINQHIATGTGTVFVRTSCYWICSWFCIPSIFSSASASSFCFLLYLGTHTKANASAGKINKDYLRSNHMCLFLAKFWTRSGESQNMPSIHRCNSSSCWFLPSLLSIHVQQTNVSAYNINKNPKIWFAYIFVKFTQPHTRTLKILLPELKLCCHDL